MPKGQQDAAHAEMEISRDLANKTLSQDKSKLAGLMDTSGSQDVPVQDLQIPAAETTKASPPRCFYSGSDGVAPGRIHERADQASGGRQL